MRIAEVKTLIWKENGVVASEALCFYSACPVQTVSCAPFFAADFHSLQKQNVATRTWQLLNEAKIS